MEAEEFVRVVLVGLDQVLGTVGASGRLVFVMSAVFGGVARQEEVVPIERLGAESGGTAGGPGTEVFDMTISQRPFAIGAPSLGSFGGALRKVLGSGVGTLQVRESLPDLGFAGRGKLVPGVLPEIAGIETGRGGSRSAVELAHGTSAFPFRGASPLERLESGEALDVAHRRVIGAVEFEESFVDFPGRGIRLRSVRHVSDVVAEQSAHRQFGDGIDGHDIEKGGAAFQADASGSMESRSSSAFFEAADGSETMIRIASKSGIGKSKTAGEVHAEGEHTQVALAQLGNLKDAGAGPASDDELVARVEVGIGVFVAEHRRHGVPDSSEGLGVVVILADPVPAEFGGFLRIEPSPHFPEIGEGIQGPDECGGGVRIIR